MSIFGDLMGRLRAHQARANEAKVNAERAANAPATPAPAPAATAPVDVEPILEGLAAASKQKLDWRHSIVDLMKLVGMESGLPQRKALAQELGYTGDTNDSATMNIWLQKQVLKKISENGGKVPASLLD